MRGLAREYKSCKGILLQLNDLENDDDTEPAESEDCYVLLIGGADYDNG